MTSNKIEGISAERFERDMVRKMMDAYDDNIVEGEEETSVMGAMLSAYRALLASGEVVLKNKITTAHSEIVKLRLALNEIAHPEAYGTIGKNPRDIAQKAVRIDGIKTEIVLKKDVEELLRDSLTAIDTAAELSGYMPRDPQWVREKHYYPVRDRLKEALAKFTTPKQEG